MIESFYSLFHFIYSILHLFVGGWTIITHTPLPSSPFSFSPFFISPPIFWQHHFEAATRKVHRAVVESIKPCIRLEKHAFKDAGGFLGPGKGMIPGKTCPPDRKVSCTPGTLQISIGLPLPWVLCSVPFFPLPCLSLPLVLSLTHTFFFSLILFFSFYFLSCPIPEVPLSPRFLICSLLSHPLFSSPHPTIQPTIIIIPSHLPNAESGSERGRGASEDSQLCRSTRPAERRIKKKRKERKNASMTLERMRKEVLNAERWTLTYACHAYLTLPYLYLTFWSAFALP